MTILAGMSRLQSHRYWPLYIVLLIINIQFYSKKRTVGFIMFYINVEETTTTSHYHLSLVIPGIMDIFAVKCLLPGDIIHLYTQLYTILLVSPSEMRWNQAAPRTSRSQVRKTGNFNARTYSSASSRTKALIILIHQASSGPCVLN